MDFKEYYHKKLNEDGVAIQNPDGTYDLDVDAPKQEPAAQKSVSAPAQGGTGILMPYVNNTSLKLGLRKLGEDLGMAIVEYATKQAVQPTDFKSEDDYIKYCQTIRVGVAEKSNKVLIETLQNIGLFIDNTIHNSCPNK